MAWLSTGQTGVGRNNQDTASPVSYSASSSNHKPDSTGSAVVDPNYYWRPMSTCPVGPKVLLLNLGGVAVLGTYNGRSKWEGWVPLPKRRPQEEPSA